MKNLRNRLKKINLRNLNFTTLAPFLIGVVILLFIIYILVFRQPSTTTFNSAIPVLPTPQEEQEQLHTDKFDQLLKTLPDINDLYSLTTLEQDGSTYVVITYNPTDSSSLDAAYLYLQTFGIFKGDSRLKVVELKPEQVGSP